MSVLKKPVSPSITKVTPIEQLANERKFTDTHVSLDAPDRSKLPKEQSVKKYKNTVRDAGFSRADRNSAIKDQAQIRRLTVVKDKVPNAEADCASCVSSPCCYLYPVTLLDAEHELGMYAGNTVTLTRESIEQLLATRYNYRFLPQVLLFHGAQESVHILKKTEDGACVYLKGGKCSIYDKRPLICKTYTCNKDPNITEPMRDGSVPVHAIVDEVFSAKR